MIAPIADRMKAVNHIRALVRWITPWEDEGKSFLIVYTGFFSVMILASLAFGSSGAALGVVQFAWFLTKLYLIYKFAISSIFILPLLVPSHRAKAIEELRKTWQKNGEPRIFDRSRTRRECLRQDTKYLRGNGFSRRSARRQARNIPC